MFNLQILRVRLKSEFKRFLWTTQIIGENICVKNDVVQEEYRFPFVWLRDNCQCSECFHSSSNSRTIDIEQFNFDVKPEKTEVSESGLKVIWSDNHFSGYTLPWLKIHRFSSKHHKYWLDNVYRPPPKPWRAKEFGRMLQRFYFKDILERDDTLLSWLECLAIWGVAVIKDGGVNENTLLNLCNRVAFVKSTQYGELFSVKLKPGTSNVAYLGGPLQLHTDLPYYEYKPGVLMLHCLVQENEQGGENQLSDGLAVCTDMKQNHPKDYKILTNTLVDWSDIVEEDGRQYYSLYRAPVISENSNGDLVQMSFSQPQRDSHFNIPLEQVIPWYKAFKIFTQTLHSSQYKVLHRLKPGEMLTIDNLRLAHGRCSYEGDRHIQGGYLDWDHVYSQIRVLRNIVQKNQN